MTDTPTKKKGPIVEYIPAEEYDGQSAEQLTQDLEVPDWEKTMEAMAQPGTTITIPRNSEFSRQQVVSAFQSAFELIGGIPRMAVWAHEHPTDFYKLYGRLLPSQANSALGETNELVIKHVLPRGPLDV